MAKKKGGVQDSVGTIQSHFRISAVETPPSPAHTLEMNVSAEEVAPVDQVWSDVMQLFPAEARPVAGIICGVMCSSCIGKHASAGSCTAIISAVGRRFNHLNLAFVRTDFCCVDLHNPAVFEVSSGGVQLVVQQSTS